MIDAIKKIDKKILILLIVMILLPIMIVLVLAIIRGCSNSTITYESYEDKMISAAQKYFEDKDKLPNEESQIVTVKLSKLINSKYIKSSKELLNDDSCSGSVSVRLNGSQVEENEGGFFNYLVNLKCNDYETKTLKNEILKSLTESGSGFYNKDNQYIFRGEDVDNYINFYGVDYRIVSMDEKGIIKLIKTESESLDIYWDNKYNTEVEDVYGKNIYEDSVILRELIKIYTDSKTISKNSKKSIVSYDLCADAIDINNIFKEKKECSNVLKNQVVSLLNTTDFANASTDPECNSIISKSCRNYNYLRGLNLKTWTYVPVLNNSYEVYYLSNGIIKHQKASQYDGYNIVIYIDSNEEVIEGNGSQITPYVIG